MKLKQFSIAITETLCMAVSILIGYLLSRQIKIIPSFIFAIPEFHVSVANLGVIILVFSITYLMVFMGMGFAYGSDPFRDSVRFAREYLAFLVAFTLASLYVYFATTINYDPQMIAAIGIISTAMLFVIHAATTSLSPGGASFFTALGAAAGAVIRGLLSLKGLLILVFFLVPPMLAVAFIANRNVANRITQIRIWINNETSGDWALVNALGTSVFHQPMLAKSVPGSDSEVYVLERDGRILRARLDGRGGVDTVLDFSARLGEVEFENGALGFAFHPEFGKAGSPKRGFFYAYFTDVREGTQTNRLVRFDLAAGPPAACLKTETPLLALSRNTSGWHNGGSLEFGPDGYLYVALGEDIRTPGHKDIKETLREGILRIDVDEQGGEKSHPIMRRPLTGITGNYFIPNDNPFLGDSNILEEFWAVGLRNPFRISFDPENGDLWAGEVGSTTWEEVNRIEKGGNYQFPYIEGHQETGLPRPPHVFGKETKPVYYYEHTAFDRAVIGGIVYRGAKSPQLRGKYIFADNYSSKVFVLETGAPVEEKVRIIAQGPEFAQRGISSVTQTVTGEILITVLGGKDSDPGKVLKLVPAAEGKDIRSDTPAVPGPAVVREYSQSDAKSIFNVNCARCHGPEGLGNGPDSAILKVKIPDFTDAGFQNSRTDAQLAKVITEGGSKNGLSPLMPAWAPILKDYEIGFLVRYVRKLGNPVR